MKKTSLWLLGIMFICVQISCEEPSIGGCMDPDAVNFNPEATEDIGGCYYLEDLPCEGESSITYNGYDYGIVRIGEQCWFAENLRTETYSNGDAITANLSDYDWNELDVAASAVYGEGDSDCYNHSPDGDACDESWSLNEYGRLYNYYAASDERNLCPNGWHVPTKVEFEELHEFVANDGHEGLEGAALKSTHGWAAAGQYVGYDAYGFSALPTGGRGTNGTFNGAGMSAGFWTSSTAGSAGYYAVGMSTGEFDGGLSIGASNYLNGSGIRCIKD